MATADAPEPITLEPAPERESLRLRIASRRAPPERQRVPGIPPESPLAEIELGMDHDEVRALLGEPDQRIERSTRKAWIPFYTGPGAYLRDWVYEGQGRVVFSVHAGSLEVFDVVYAPGEGDPPPTRDIP